LPATPALSPAARTEAALAAAVAAARRDASAMTLFLEDMPKGGDLHHHLTGAVYAESYIGYAVADGDCIDATFTIVPPPCVGKPGMSPASRAVTDYLFRNAVIDALSARNYTPAPGDESPLVHFFQTFFRFNEVTNGHWPEELAEVIHRAALQHELYLETMLSPDMFKSLGLGARAGWDDNFDRMRSKLDAGGVPALVTESRRNLDEAETGEQKLLHCGTLTADVGCGLTVRYIFQVLRDEPKEQVFAQIQTAFELANVDPRVVSVNPVQPQDDYTPMSDFSLHMRMFGYFHKRYPKVHLSMHAGELWPGIGKPEEMESPSHIRETIEVGGAERIGHGLDVLYERDPRGLLAMMARKHILVEDPIVIHEILAMGPTGDVLPIYLKAGVPVALATDDEGGARSNLTAQFVRAAQGYHVDYYGLKRMVRDSLEHGFMGGADLWSAPEAFGSMMPACAGIKLTIVASTPACRAFLTASVRASLEWKEENAFAAFESRFSFAGLRARVRWFEPRTKIVGKRNRRILGAVALATGDAGDDRIGVRLAEEGGRIPFATGAIDDAVCVRDVDAVRPAHHRIADITHERSRHGVDGNPGAVAAPHLEAVRVVLREQGDAAVIRMRAGTVLVAVKCAGMRRIVEHAQRGERAIVLVDEVVGRNAEVGGNRAMDQRADGKQLVEVADERCAKAR
jgi:adenosine deaminase